MSPVLPVPSPENVARFQAFYLARLGKELEYGEAADALTRLMQFTYLNAGAACYGLGATEAPIEGDVPGKAS